MELKLLELTKEEVEMIMKERERQEKLAHRDEVIKAFQYAYELAKKYNIVVIKPAGQYVYACEREVVCFKPSGDDAILIN